MQEFEVMAFETSDFKDDFGNTWCNVAFVGHANEPIRWVLKDPSTVQVGDKVYGEIVTKTSKAGKPYQRFYKKERDGAPVSNSTPDKSSAYLKDLSDTPKDIFKAGLAYVDTVNLMKDPKYLDEYISFVERVSDRLISKMEAIRSGGQKPATEPLKAVTEVFGDEYSDENIRQSFNDL